MFSEYMDGQSVTHARPPSIRAGYTRLSWQALCTEIAKLRVLWLFCARDQDGPRDSDVTSPQSAEIIEEIVDPARIENDASKRSFEEADYVAIRSGGQVRDDRDGSSARFAKDRCHMLQSLVRAAIAAIEVGDHAQAKNILAIADAEFRKIVF